MEYTNWKRQVGKYKSENANRTNTDRKIQAEKIQIGK